jgi:hypothetical protein
MGPLHATIEDSWVRTAVRMDRYAEQRCKNGREHAVSVRALRPEEQQAELAWLSRGAGDVATSTTHDGPVHMGDEMPGGGG